MNTLVLSGYKFLHQIDDTHILMEHAFTGVLLLYDCKNNSYVTVGSDLYVNGIPFAVASTTPRLKPGACKALVD